MKKSGILILLGIILYTCLSAQIANPVLHCAHKTDNTATVSWTFDGTCGAAFTAWNIYFANSPTDPFQLLISIDAASTPGAALINDYEDLTIGPNNRCYYIEAVCGTNVGTSEVVCTTLPEAPDLNFVTVLSDTQVQIVWGDTSPSPDTHGYVIYQSDPGVVAIDTVYYGDPEYNAGTNQFIYTDSGPNTTPNTNAETYTIAAIDSCDNVGSWNINGHTTIFLEADNDSCDNVIFMNWSAYEGWDLDEIEEYLIYDENGTNLVGGVGADTLTYRYELADGQNSACLAVSALNQNGESSISNVACVDVTIKDGPEYIYITNVTVNDNNDVDITWLLDTEGQIKTLDMNRGESLNNLDSGKSYNTGFTSEMSYIDTDVITSNFSYYYQISSIDSCDAATTSEAAKTILLTGSGSLDLNNELEWTPFEIGYGTITEYNILRVDGGIPSVITTVPPTETTYIDIVPSDVTPNPEGVCYRIQAVYDLALPDSTVNNLNSLSNTVCLSPPSRIFVPTAFRPNGLNKEFKPVIMFPNYDNYQMVILNRWGEIVFESTNPDIGWDGFHKNELAPQGVYAFMIQMQNTKGQIIEEKGSVLLLR